MKKHVQVYFFLCALLGCQTPPPTLMPPRPDEALFSQMPPHPPQLKNLVSDPWFGSARMGDWKKFELLQQDLDRPWDYQHANGQTALMIAARNGQVTFIQNLINKRVNINLTDRLGFDALSYALNGPKTMDSKKALCLLFVKNGADAFAEDHVKLSAILLMIEYGFLKCLQEVSLTKDAPCDQSNRLTEVKSLVTYAEKEEEYQIRDYLKKQGCR